RPVGLLDDVECLRRVPEHESRIADGRERNPPDALREVVRRLGRSLQREPRLPGAAGAGQRQQADAVPQLPDDVHELPVAAEKLRRRYGEIRQVEGTWAREFACTE